MIKNIFKDLEFIQNNLKHLKVQADDDVLDYRKAAAQTQIRLTLKKIKLVHEQLDNLYKYSDDKDTIDSAVKLADLMESSFNSKKSDMVKEAIDKMQNVLADVKIRKDPFEVHYSKIPVEIREDIQLDVQEMKSNFQIGNYRSSIILCGRILETSLHRLYYEKTKKDLLETSPGIGLGKVIAKLKEQNVKLPVAMSEQIHIVNNARIASVHKQKEPFRPTKEQAQAIILYCIDVLNKLF
ncbi:DUF4145 domain-containing protein [Candidatus Woesearchaeota archaeon]|nr:DUF4145 domain-containing protein [Candidatus Woesearchaeota archaeon]MBW3017095.1 DUF4145 domain-containing protein [Candidatus Woesearchaeota archaeon]